MREHNAGRECGDREIGTGGVPCVRCTVRCDEAVKAGGKGEARRSGRRGGGDGGGGRGNMPAVSVKAGRERKCVLGVMLGVKRQRLWVAMVGQGLAERRAGGAAAEVGRSGRSGARVAGKWWLL